ncbi:GAF domain-containing protein [Leucobacter exalbidus]|uniref:GAF domain-containing protein n=1 Tax=Leucobacter exalbidus TaxID=662960 RepID=A0A940PQN8_9MICO|nr:GAF domain-containing protein [Leucobacter exalbidus]MBP1327370.1 GAF domain-containing protein [Leucobacter exalbidus]
MKNLVVPTANHDELVAWARRQQRLTSSISEFAIAITSIRDNSEALQQLVARARTLLDVDMAYISLNGIDGSGFTSIVETSGVWTEEYRTLQMPLGSGVLGRVAQAGGPVQTSDYSVDDTLMHDDGVDRVVEAEGVRAILGAPMRSGGEIIGALLVANRFVQPFTAEQVYVTQTLANLAAVAIDNMNRVADLKQIAQELREAEAAAQRELATERRVTGADEALMDAIAGGGGLGALRDGMTRAIGRTVQLVDLTVRYDMRAAAAEIGDAERPLFALSARTGTPQTHTREDGSSHAIMAATRNDELVGAVMVEGELSPSDEQVLQRCARVLGAFLSAQDRERGDLARRRRELIDQVLAPAPSGLSFAVVTQLTELGIEAGKPFRILVVDGSESTLRDFSHRLEVDFGPSLLHAKLGEQIVGVVPEAAFTRIQHELEERGARRWGAMLVGHSPKLHMFEVVPDEFALVERVLEAARRSNFSQTLVSLKTYGAIGAFLSKVTLEPTRLGVTEVIGAVLDYDRDHGTALAETAAAFLHAGHSVAQAALDLRVHENTVRQRLDRVGTLLGDGWAYGQRGLDCHIMLAAHRLIGR